MEIKKFKEDFVSFEIAKLLKQKGFDWDCWKVYGKDGEKGVDFAMHFTEEQVPTNYFERDYLYLCPTLQVVKKWLFEVHKIYINVYWCYSKQQKKIIYRYDVNRFVESYDEYPAYETYSSKRLSPTSPTSSTEQEALSSAILNSLLILVE